MTGRLFAVLVIFALTLVVIAQAGHGEQANQGRSAADRATPARDGKRQILDFETGIYAIRPDGTLLLRARRYDVRDFPGRATTAGTKQAGNLLRSLGWYESSGAARIVLLPIRPDGKHWQCACDIVGEKPPRALLNVLGSRGWYELRPDMQLLLYPAGSWPAMPGSLGRYPRPDRARDPDAPPSKSEAGLYYIATNGDLIAVRAKRSDPQ